MKIKRFNESRKATQVKQDAFMDKKRNHTMEDFSSIERKKVIEILMDRKNRQYIRWSFNSDFLEIWTDNNSTEVVKLDDLWFTVIRTCKWGRNDYFICDDETELYDFLKTEYL
jgi:hypothetical protein